MKRSWMGAALFAAIAVVFFWIREDAQGVRPTPVDVTTNDDVTVSEQPAPAKKGSRAPDVVAPVVDAPATAKPADERSEDRTDPKVGTAKDRTSLVDRAWNERASQRAFDGAENPSPDQYPLTRDGIQSAVRASKPELQKCYESWVKMQPGLGGKIVVKLEISNDEDDPTAARIGEVTLPSSELQHPFMEGCIQSVMKDLKFDPPKDGKMTVNYPLVFSNDADEDGAGN